MATDARRDDAPANDHAGSGGTRGVPGTVAVVGLGLMGGSLVRALASSSPTPRVLGIDPDPIRGSRLREEGTLARFGLPGDGTAAEAGLVVLACPLGAALEFIRDEARALPPETLLTDLVSLNAPLLRAAAAAAVADRYVTAHPMCGAETSGLDGARATLFADAKVWLSSGPESGADVRGEIEGFWTAVGGRTAWIEAGEHDRRMGWVSHLPQLVACALAGALDAAGCRPEDLGPGGRDMVRLAGSSPVLWRELLEHSAPVTGAGLTSVSRGLGAVADLLARRELDRIEEFMELTRAWARGEAALADEAGDRADSTDVGASGSSDAGPSGPPTSDPATDTGPSGHSAPDRGEGRP